MNRFGRRGHTKSGAARQESLSFARLAKTSNLRGKFGSPRERRWEARGEAAREGAALRKKGRSMDQLPPRG
jgi:hypothetical protein